MGRRHPPPVPPLDDYIPQGLPEQQRAGLLLFARKLVDYLRHLRDGFSGDPAPHAATHAVGGTDTLATGTPAELFIGDTPGTGLGPGHARYNHIHSLVKLHAEVLSRASLRP